MAAKFGWSTIMIPEHGFNLMSHHEGPDYGHMLG